MTGCGIALLLFVLVVIVPMGMAMCAVLAWAVWKEVKIAKGPR